MARLPARRAPRAAIRAMVAGGHGLDEIERRLIAPSEADEDARAALWLYAWALLERGVPRGARLAVASG